MIYRSMLSRTHRSLMTCPTIALALVLVLGACSGSSSGGKSVTIESAPIDYEENPSSLSGFWEKRGYGQLISIEEDETSIYQVNQHNCQLLFSADNAVLDDFLGTVIVAADEQSFNTQAENIEGDTHPYTYSKLATLPQPCRNGGTAPTNDSLVNFDVLWHSFNDRYAFFDLPGRAVDWAAVKSDYRDSIGNIVDEGELYGAFLEILRLTNDGHVHLTWPDAGIERSAGLPALWYQRLVTYFEANKSFESLQQAFEEQNEYDDFNNYRNAMFLRQQDELFAQNSVNLRAYFGDLDCRANGQLCFGISDGNVGYLSIGQMAFYAYDGSEVDEDLAVLRPALDTILSAMASTVALIIDIRLNPGGQDSNALEIAGRFTGTAMLAFHTKARDKEGFANEHDVLLVPTGESQYSAPVYLLTSNATASGAEAFAMTMAQLDQVTLIGEPTFGVLSDQNSITLPNGWEVTLSNEVRSDAHSRIFEGVGVPVDVPVDVLVPEEVLAGKDTAVDKALALIATQ